MTADFLIGLGAGFGLCVASVWIATRMMLKGMAERVAYGISEALEDMEDGDEDGNPQA